MNTRPERDQIERAEPQTWKQLGRQLGQVYFQVWRSMDDAWNESIQPIVLQIIDTNDE